MKIGILAVGEIAPDVLVGLQQGLVKTFPDTACTIIKKVLPVPKVAFNKKRNQYSSSLILNEIRAYASKHEKFHGVLGLVDVDIFVPELNYVFGEAYTPGKAALISLWRLKPKFYGENAGSDVFTVAGFEGVYSRVGSHVGFAALPEKFVCYAFF